MTLENEPKILDAVADIVRSYVSNNKLTATELPSLITGVYKSLMSRSIAAATAESPPQEPQVPAVSIRSSVKPDHIICLEDGKRLTMLRPYIMRHFGLTPQAYRQKWKLPADYPMTAPDYIEKRRRIAMEIGLGVRGRIAVTPTPVPAAKPKRVKAAQAESPPATPAQPSQADRGSFDPADLDDALGGSGKQKAAGSHSNGALRSTLTIAIPNQGKSRGRPPAKQ
jgi:predicted transcriptional regulator